MYDFRFLNVPQKEITRDNILKLCEDESTKRIHFSTSHKNALKEKNGSKPAKIILPFDDTIGSIIKGILGEEYSLFKSQFEGYWRAIDNEEQYDKIKIFIDNHRQLVFLRDNLDLSICLSMNFGEDNQHTEIGELEYQAKFNNNNEAEKKLIELSDNWINELPYYKIADCICAMPCSNPKEESLPKRIVNSLEKVKIKNISDKVYWKNKKRKVKDAQSILDKMEIIEKSDLTIECDVKGKTIILIDDLYMSGVSLQFVAMKLKESGAKRVFGMCLVKSRGNTIR